MSAYAPKYAGPIQVATLDAAAHFAEGAVDRRLQVGRIGAVPAPDIIILRGWKAATIMAAAADVPRAAFDRVTAGQAMLVLDASGEGPGFDITSASVIHKLLREVGVPTARTVYLTQNRAWETLYRAFCFTMSVEPVQVLHYDYYIRNFFRGHEADGEAAFEARLAAYRGRAAEREKRFVCLNYTPRPAKMLFLLKLLQGGQFDQGFISFPGFDKSLSDRATKRTTAMLEVLALPGLEDLAAELLPLIHDLDRRGCVLFDSAETGAALAGHYTSLANDAALAEYNRAWFTVITESEMHGPRRITEKPFKPLANFSPYITLGNPGSLALVRDFGFRTFGSVFDEAYDAELDVRRRFLMVHAEIARLCALPEAALRDLEAALADDLTFNARRALIDMPRLYREELEPRLVDRLMDVRNGVAPAPV